MARNKKKLTEEEKKERRKEQKRRYIQKRRQKMSESELEERRRKDREKYQKKKASGEIKTIKEQTPRAQRRIRKGWRERAQKYRDKIRQLKRQEQDIINNDTPPPSPAVSVANGSASQISGLSSRSERGKWIADRNRRRLRHENLYLRSKLKQMENMMAKYRMRLLRQNKNSKSISIEPGEQTSNRKKERILKMKKAVRDFLEQDDSSRSTTGKRETITKNKVKKQRRLLNDTLINLYKKFITESGMKMSYAFFCRNRPFWILIPDARKRDTCLCTTHENMELMIKAMKGCKMIDANSSNDIVKIMCCDGHLKEDCIKRQCSMCKDKKLNFNIYEGNDMISCERWINKKGPIKIKNVTRLCQKTIKETFKISKANLSRMFVVDKLPKFMTHVYNIVHQYRISSKIKATLRNNEAFLRVDFAENYNCKYSKEVQSAHFGGSKPQISMHTAVLYIKSSDQNSAIECFCSISENLRHDPVLICAHLKPIFEEIKRKVPSLQTMHFQSDGPTTQYRNKSMFYLIVKFISRELEVENILWHFSEAGHGKGAPDGVGGYLKRTADASVATGNDVSNFEAFVNCLQEKCKGIRIFPIDDTHVNYISDILSTSGTLPFKGTLRIHQLAWSRKNPEIIHARRLSCANCSPDQFCCHFGLGNIIIKGKEETLDGNVMIENPDRSSATHSNRNESSPPSPIQAELSGPEMLTNTLEGRDFYRMCYSNSSDTEAESEIDSNPPCRSDGVEKDVITSEHSYAVQDINEKNTLACTLKKSGKRIRLDSTSDDDYIITEDNVKAKKEKNSLVCGLKKCEKRFRLGSKLDDDDDITKDNVKDKKEKNSLIYGLKKCGKGFFSDSDDD